jgi:hypothetical protein
LNKITFLNKDGYRYITTKLQGNQQINMREVDVLNQRSIEGLLPVIVLNASRSISLKYDATSLISFESFSKNVLSKKQFVDMLLYIAKLFKATQEVYLYNKNILLDYKYIMVNPQSKKLFFAYLPIQNYENSLQLKSFFLDMVFKLVFNKFENTDYVKKYIEFLNNRTSFSLYEFEEFLHKIDKEILNNSINNSRNISLEEKQKCTACGYMNDSDARFCVDCGNDLKVEKKEVNSTTYTPIPIDIDDKSQKDLIIPDKLQVRNPTGRPETQSFNETTVLGADNVYGTTVLSDEELNEPSYPYLIRKKTGEKIILDKPVYRIGKEKSYVDYFVVDNGAVSRSHADFISSNGKFFVQDKNSTNKTYINGIAIPINKEVEIFDGQIISLANEEFMFMVK